METKRLIKFLADVNVERDLVSYFSRYGYDIKWIPDYNCELSDEDVLNLAKKEKRILLTNDKDFGELVFFQKKISTGIILFRIKGQNVAKKIKTIHKILINFNNKILNHFIVISDKKMRFISMEEKYE